MLRAAGQAKVARMTKRLLLPAAMLASLAGCAQDPPPFAPVTNVAYAALGDQPFWMVTIGDDRIVLALGAPGGTAGKGGKLTSHAYPRVLPRTDSGATIWQSGEGTEVISIESRKAARPCEAGGRHFEDSVRVTLSGRMLEGCGGRLLAGSRG
ncbi:hypothetical protein C7I55_13245 [Sphingomonas deserti]|uniref:Uncharacterized protein n=2 Tax=Allosphingosinicella deserti TaxID=2116704 RepID=A0A2P7QNN6_9SPHN|nr:hypothetical protein C7I55_13245 [Sphingomonas deserti]